MEIVTRFEFHFVPVGYKTCIWLARISSGIATGRDVLSYTSDIFERAVIYIVQGLNIF